MIQQFLFFVGVIISAENDFPRSFCYLHRNKRTVIEFRVKPKTNIVILCHRNAISLQFTSLKLFMHVAKRHKDICDNLSSIPKSFHTNNPQEEGIAILHNAILVQFSEETFNVILKKAL